MIYPKLTLIGAGPGDPKLLTIKGLESLRSANVILYDALVNPAILDLTFTEKRIFVGKRAGHHELSQDQINQMIVEYARKFGHVVRLKGGDPFVFGRGSEELEYAEKFGIETEIIPGITSAIAVPALFNIPVTRRSVSDSFWVIAGTNRQGEISSDLQIAAQTSATIVILMGFKKLREIIKVFIESGKTQLPIAIIEKGSLPEARILTGKVENIVELSRLSGIKPPAIIIIGDVVKSAKRLKEIKHEYV